MGRIISLAEKREVCENSGYVPFDDNTKQALLQLDAQIKMAQQQIQLILSTFINAKGLSGMKWRVSQDGSGIEVVEDES